MTEPKLQLPAQRVITGKVVTGYNPTINITVNPQSLANAMRCIDEINAWLESNRPYVHTISAFEAARLDKDAIDQ